MARVCQALNLSDEKQCQEEATHADDLFCGLHARQCMGMYLGYKRRNAQLDSLNASPPDYLARSRAPLRNETFAAVQDEKTLNELYHYLVKKHNLLDRVIRARRLHHAHFYSQALDYGHKQYLDRLVNDKSSVTHALEKLQRRTAEVLYEQQKWFKWVRQRQDEEEETRENESKKVKKEALLFKRHMKAVNARLSKKRRLEEQKRQDAYLDKAYEERLRQESEDDIEFDPIEDAIEDEREDYVDLVRRLMWLTATSQEYANGAGEAETDKSTALPDRSRQTAAIDKENVNPKDQISTNTNATGNALTRNAKKRAKAKAKAEARQEEENTPKAELIETRDEMRERLIRDQAFDAHEGMHGTMLAGTVDRPTGTIGRIPGMPVDEVDKILDEVAEIKQLLLCRQLLSQAALLPAAIRAGSVDEFLADPEINTNDLRDLCLRIEQPALQEIRDACADFARGDAEDDDDDDDGGLEDEQDAFDKSLTKKDAGFMRKPKKRLPSKWNSRREELNEFKKHIQQARPKDDGGQAIIDFGELDDEGKFKNKKIRVRVCGRTIWNYPSDKAMARGGWLHYSIMAKGTRFEDAIALCRNWQEFWELNVLALWQYFPSTTWGRWERNQITRQLLQQGLIPYSEFTNAEKTTGGFQQRNRGQGPSQHSMAQSRNFLCAHMKRNDPVSRRFVQYLSMMSNDVCILVRDAKTGRILVRPPEEQLWLVRKKSGMGRASRNEWDVIAKVGKDMFEKLSEYKSYGGYEFGFNAYYDITIWDLEPGQPFAYLFNMLNTVLAKAYRACSGADLYNPVASVIKTLHRDPTTSRVRDVRPGEQSIYDDLYSRDFQVLSGDMGGGADSFSEVFPKDFFYNERDAAEDAVLFPDEGRGEVVTAIKGFDDPISLILEQEPDLKRFAYDLDTDDDGEEFEGLEPNDPNQTTRVLTDGEPDDSDLPEIPDHIPICPSPDDPDCSCEECIWYKENVPEEPQGLDALLPRGLSSPEAEELKRLTSLAMAKNPIPDGPEMYDQWVMFMEREASKAFRNQWHEADIAPGSKERWQAMTGLLADVRLAVMPKSLEALDLSVITELLKMELWLEYPKTTHRLVRREMREALQMASLSFQWTSQHKLILAGLSPEKLRLLGDLTNNAAKAKGEPYPRSIASAETRPDDFWQIPRQEIKDNNRNVPDSWDMVARPVTAAWFRAGMLCPAYAADGSGQVSLIKEEGKEEPSIFIDYHDVVMDYPPEPSSREIDLLRHARDFAKTHGNPRFALLRLWSHSHFWPLMLAGPNREMMSFLDTYGRCWHSRFIPKDMPYSDISLHNQVQERTKRFKKQFQGKVVFKRDMALVMGETEEALRWNVAGAIFALSTRPWRFEVDLWKSFVNVDLEFLAKLGSKWLD